MGHHQILQSTILHKRKLLWTEPTFRSITSLILEGIHRFSCPSDRNAGLVAQRAQTTGEFQRLKAVLNPRSTNQAGHNTYPGLAVGFPNTNCTVANTTLSSVAQRSRSSQIEFSGFNMTRRYDEVKAEYIIYPKTGMDEDNLSKTEANIKSITQLPRIFSYRDINKELLMWTVDVPETQLRAIQKYYDVDLIEENVVELKYC